MIVVLQSQEVVVVENRNLSSDNSLCKNSRSKNNKTPTLLPHLRAFRTLQTESIEFFISFVSDHVAVCHASIQKTPSRCTMRTGPSAHALPVASGPLLPPPAPSTAFPRRCGSRYLAAHLLYPRPSNIEGHVVYVLAVRNGCIRWLYTDGPADGKEARRSGRGGREAVTRPPWAIPLNVGYVNGPMRTWTTPVVDVAHAYVSLATKEGTRTGLLRLGHDGKGAAGGVCRMAALQDWPRFDCGGGCIGPKRALQHPKCVVT